MDYHYQINSSLGSHYAMETDELCEEGLAAKFSSIATGDFKWKNLEAFFYHDGRLEDFSLNGWLFSYRIEGCHRIYNAIGPDSPEFEICGLDPLRQQFKAYVYTSGFFKEAAADFMNNIALYSKFPNRDVAQAFNTLQFWKRQSEWNSKLDPLPLIKELKNFFTIYHATDDTDAVFRDKIKLIINDSLNDYIKTIEKLRL